MRGSPEQGREVNTGLPAFAPALRRARGFTLIEVIVALALFAVGATILAAAYVNVLNALDSVKGDQAFEQAIVLVRSQILQEPDREVIEDGDELPTARFGQAHWRAVVTPSETIADLFRVDLEITFDGSEERPEPRTVEQSLWVLRPDWSEPTERDALRARTRERLQELKRGRSL